MITDLNDETPRFKSEHYRCEIAENSPINTPITFLGNGLPEVYDYDQVRPAQDSVSYRKNNK